MDHARGIGFNPRGELQAIGNCLRMNGRDLDGGFRGVSPSALGALSWQPRHDSKRRVAIARLMAASPTRRRTKLVESKPDLRVGIQGVEIGLTIIAKSVEVVEQGAASMAITELQVVPDP